jgi:hypothetical protein
MPGSDNCCISFNNFSNSYPWAGGDDGIFLIITSMGSDK